MAHWKARGRLYIRRNWTFFAITYGWDVMSGNGSTVEVSVFRRGSNHFDRRFQREGASPTNHSWSQSNMVIALSCGIKISAVRHLVLSQCTRVTDEQTYRQNYDSQDRPRICSRGKNQQNISKSYQAVRDFVWYLTTVVIGYQKSYCFSKRNLCSPVSVCDKVCKFFQLTLPSQKIKFASLNMEWSALANIKIQKLFNDKLTSFEASSKAFFSADPSHLSILTGLSVPFCSNINNEGIIYMCTCKTLQMPYK